MCLQVVYNVGLCICLYDITKLEDSYIFPGDGASHTKGTRVTVTLFIQTDEQNLSSSLSLLQFIFDMWFSTRSWTPFWWERSKAVVQRAFTVREATQNTHDALLLCCSSVAGLLYLTKTIKKWNKIFFKNSQFHLV